MVTDDFPSVTDTDGGSPDHPAIEPPRIQGYEILAKLGEGGMGVVWSAIHRPSKRRVALKQMKPHTLFSSTARVRFQREMEVAANLEHPHIARVYDCNLEQQPYFFTMEWIQGQRIDQHVLANNYSPRQIAELFVQVCHGVAHAHRNAVIHRDLKPSNILVSEAGEPYIVDFGVAKQVDDDAPELTVSSLGTGPGTLNYMSPEQVTGGKVDTRSDIYALGTILYQLLTDRLPYNLTGSDYERMQRIANDEPTPLRVAVPEMESDLEAIVLAALAKEPTERYQSAGELASDLENWLNGRAISIKSDHALYLVRKLMRKHRYTSVVIALLAVILISFSWVGLYAYQEARDAGAKVIDLERQLVAKAEWKRNLSQRIAFLVLLESFHQGDLALVRGTASALPKDTKERLAAESWLDPNDPQTKLNDMVEKMGEKWAWFAYCVTGEDFLQRDRHREAQQAFQRSFERLPDNVKDSQYRFDNGLVEHIQARLYQLSELSNTAGSGEAHHP